MRKVNLSIRAVKILFSLFCVVSFGSVVAAFAWYVWVLEHGSDAQLHITGMVMAVAGYLFLAVIILVPLGIFVSAWIQWVRDDEKW